MEEENCSEAILAALLSLNSTRFSNLLRTLASDSLFQLQRLRALLLSPLRFLRTLRYIDSLSLPQKTHLIARLLLRSLQRITHHLSDDHTSDALLGGTLGGFQDYDAGLLLYTLCQLSDSERLRLAESSDWWATVADHVAREALRFSGLGSVGWAVLSPHVDAAMKCRRFIEAAGCWREKGEGRAAASVVVSIGAAVVSGGSTGWRECVICKEELREACELPCSHVFHRVCIARWLTKNNTCPYCRLELPTDDVFCEIQRLWKLIVARSRLDLRGDCISKRI
ncbi:E3 ubiquitin-protein ligase SGR9, amyloplastic-like [Aristolochia californica]|uniref:E3 ubiquitin-protein ligase SGR9, amyloplastic-like n=1 Tax=Aristolochia californica TaxID=171875 RepID=UPI0035E1A051